MHGRGVSRRGLIGLTATVVAVLVVWNNLVITRLPGYPASYVVINMAAAAVLLAAARWTGLTWEELGLAPRRMPAGLALGGVCVATIAAAYVVALVVPALRPLLTDARVGRMDAAEITYQTLVRVPFGTVLWEEIAFRGVLLAALLRLFSVRVATVVSAVVFGIWHIRPTLSAVAANDFVHGAVATGAVVLLACLGTAVAGVLFTVLRLRSGSLLAPVLLHLATNSLGTLAAAAAIQLQ
jgi:membrane protease YdiL (CAAX protease family)